MINQLWYKMLDIKYGEIYLSKYIQRQHFLKKIFQIMILIVSASGILGWKYFEDYAWLAFLLICVMQIFLLIKNQLIFSEKEMEYLTQLKMGYTKYNIKLEKLWAEYFRHKKEEDDVLDLFYKFQEKDWQNIEDLDNKINIKKIKKLDRLTKNEIQVYLKKYHNYD